MGESTLKNASNIQHIQSLILEMSQAKYVLFVNHTVLSSLLCVFEIGSDLVSVIVFVKQGLRSSININFAALSLVDLTKCFFYLWINISVLIYTFELFHALPVVDTFYLISAWPIAANERIALFITAYVTIERYVSVAAPLHVKKFLTPQRTLAILIAIVIVNVATIIPIYITTNLGWKYFPEVNLTLYSVVFNGNKIEMEEITYAFHALLEFFSICLISLFSFILIVQLKRQSNWRHIKSAATVLKKKDFDNRDAKTNKMVITVAALTSVCHLPLVTLAMTTEIVKDFRVYGAIGPLFSVLYSFTFVFSGINSAAKIFIFYKMSSKFRFTFKKLLK